jgi:MSHA pilin protein MshD
MCSSRRQRGMTLIELIVFIVIVSTALAGVLTVLNITAKNSADPMIRKQALAIAESVLEEVMLRPFTWCDPDDATAATATSATVGVGPTFCTATLEGMGPEAGETRGDAVTPFDNINDYNSAAISTNIAGGGATLYVANVSVAQAVLNDIDVASSAALLITVSVTAGSETIQLQGYRARHSPNFLP